MGIFLSARPKYGNSWMTFQYEYGDRQISNTETDTLQCTGQHTRTVVPNESGYYYTDMRVRGTNVSLQRSRQFNARHTTTLPSSGTSLCYSSGASATRNGTEAPPSYSSWRMEPMMTDVVKRCVSSFTARHGIDIPPRDKKVSVVVLT